LQSDVNVKLVFELSEKIKKRILQEDTPPGLTKKEHFVKIVYDELVSFLGKDESKINETAKPTKIMLLGLFGNGKTTTAGKLAKFLQKRGKKVALVQTDTWRPAAYEQLQQLAKQINVDFYGDKNIKEPHDIFKKFEKDLQNYDYVIIDTAGRDALSEELVEELKKINKAVNADERLLVIGADIGQGAEKQAVFFHKTVNITGVIITKLDGTAKGGGALTACAVTGTPVKFIGVGEQIDDLEKFVPERFVSRLLGMGDIETLLEKAKEAIPEEKAKDIGRKFLKGEFNLLDLYEQVQAMKKMGSFSKILNMIPGMSKFSIPKEMLQKQEQNLEKWKYILNSCTKKELEEPEIISADHVERIAKGSGTSIEDVRNLLKQYKQGKKLVKVFKGGGNKKMKQMMKQFGGQLPEGLF